MKLIELRKRTREEVEKSQAVRIIDVLIIGPYLIYLGQKGTVTNADKAVLVFLGITTLLYNLNNYIKNQKSEEL